MMRRIPSSYLPIHMSRGLSVRPWPVLFASDRRCLACCDMSPVSHHHPLYTHPPPPILSMFESNHAMIRHTLHFPFLWGLSVCHFGRLVCGPPKGLLSAVLSFCLSSFHLFASHLFCPSSLCPSILTLSLSSIICTPPSPSPF